MVNANLKKVISLIEKGNNLGEKIFLVGATKMVDVDVINDAIKNGLEIVAENKVQEFREKTDKIFGAKQHFIGHLQTNKVKYLVGNVDLIQSVDSLNLAQTIDKEAKKQKIVQNILIEINIGEEPTKSGFSYLSAKEQIKNIANSCSSVKILGLMAMLPQTEDKDYLANLCRKMRSLYNELKEENFDLKYLSVGISSDYEIAIQNGSNMIRLGRTIFGQRNYGER